MASKKEKTELSEDDVNCLSEFFNVLGVSKRLMTLILLAKKLPAMEIAKKLGIARSTLQKHLDVLRDSGLVRYGGKEEYYELTEFGKHVLSWLSKEAVKNLAEAIKLEKMAYEAERTLEVIRERGKFMSLMLGIQKKPEELERDLKKKIKELRAQAAKLLGIEE